MLSAILSRYGGAATECRHPQDRKGSSLAPCSLGYSPRSLVEAKLGSAIGAQPNENLRRVGPEKRGDFAGHLNGSVNLQTLESLHIEHAIVKRALYTVFLMNTLALPKLLLPHKK